MTSDGNLQCPIKGNARYSSNMKCEVLGLVVDNQIREYFGNSDVLTCTVLCMTFITSHHFSDDNPTQELR